MNASAAIADSLLRRAFGWQGHRSPVSQRDCAISLRTVMNNAG